jgi:hypothetical protein
MLRSAHNAPVLSVFALTFSLLITLPIHAAPPNAVSPAADPSSTVITWANNNIFAYNTMMGYVRHAPAPQVPVPPMVDPPCHLCGASNTTSAAETQVDNWVAQNEKPEADYIKTLAQMGHELALLQGLPSNELSPAALTALGKFSESEINEALVKLGHRLYEGKGIPMAQQYDHEPKQAYAGIKFLLAVARDSAILNGLNGSSTSADGDEAIQLSKTWMQSIADKIDNDIVSGHKYNLCPVYASIFRQVELLGGPSTDMTSFQQTVQKMQDLLKFDVKLNLKANGNMPDGSHFDITWSGKAKMHLDIDMSNSCYTPVVDNGGQMAVSVQNFTMIGIDKHSDGSEEQIPVTLISDHNFNVTVEQPLLNLCDPSPILQIPFSAASFPQETIQAKGHSSKTSLFGSFLDAVIAPNNVNRKETNEVTGAAPKVESAPAPSNDDNKQMNDAQAQLNAHKGDINWLMGPQGQAAIAAIQKQVTAIVQNKIAAAGVSTPNVSSITDIAKSIGAAHLDWSNGSGTPASKTLHVDKDGAHFSATFTVTQSAH